MVEHSVLQPVDIRSLPNAETQEAAPWIMRKLVGSLTGRIVMASFETLRATGTSIICLSPWGDSSPLLLPCIRFRDLVVHSVIVVTGGTAAFVTPAMAPLADAVASSSFASTIAVEIAENVGREAVVKGGDWLLVDKPLDILLGKHNTVWTTTSVKTILITLKYKHIVDDAALGFFRSPVHSDPSLISNVGDYFAVEKGWFSPYLFATSRRPVIPRTMKADVIFAHGPFLTGDYQIAETLLKESTIALHFCVPPPPRIEPETKDTPIADAMDSAKAKLSSLVPDKPATGQSRSPSPNADLKATAMEWKDTATDVIGASYKRLSGRLFHHDKTPAAAPGPALADPTPQDTNSSALPDGVDATDIDPTIQAPPPPRRMVVLLLGLKPHRAGVWTTSARPGESLMYYLLLNGCPAIVVPLRPGSPLLAWDTLTLAQLHQYKKDGRRSAGIVRILFEFISLCVDWDRVILPKREDEDDKEDVDGKAEESALSTSEATAKAEEGVTEIAAPSVADPDGSKEKALKDALEVLVEAAMSSGDSKDVKDKVDPDRAGIAMFRLP